MVWAALGARAHCTILHFFFFWGGVLGGFRGGANNVLGWPSYKIFSWTCCYAIHSSLALYLATRYQLSGVCSFFLLTLSLLLFFLLIFLFSLPLPCSAFHLSILSEVWLLNFLRLLICDGNSTLVWSWMWFAAPLVGLRRPVALHLRASQLWSRHLPWLISMPTLTHTTDARWRNSLDAWEDQGSVKAL